MHRVSDMKSKLAIAVLLLIVVVPASTPDAKAQTAIRAVLDAQAAAWNHGDLEGYMEGYDRSPNTEFVTGDRINRGWQAVKEATG